MRTSPPAYSRPDSGHVQQILGPPGTGKTTRLLSLIKKDLERYSLSQIAFVSFSKAACEESLTRLKAMLGRDTKAPWFRTIHSLGYSIAREAGLISNSASVMDRRSLREFAKSGSWKLSTEVDEDDLESSATNEHDALRLAMEWSRSRCKSLEDGVKAMNLALGKSFTVQDAQRFVDSYEQWKRREKTIDFLDMLERGVEAGTALGIPIVYIDEAQDLSPLQQRAVEVWFRDCEFMVIAGDDDQAIYEFQGCDHRWMVEMSRKADEVTVLDQSYRIPERVHGYALGMIARNAATRLQKEYRPRVEPGLLRRASEDSVLDEIETLSGMESFFYLARTNKLATGFVARLAEKRLSWQSFSGKSGRIPDPFEVALARHAVEFLVGRKSGMLRPGMLDAILKYAGRPQLPWAEREFLWNLNGRLRPVTGAEAADGVPAFVSSLKRKPWGFLGSHMVDEPVRAALEVTCQEHGYEWLLDEPKWTIGTIHGSKGREADVVVVGTTWSKRAMTEMARFPTVKDTENRLAYVGITRAKKALWIADREGEKYVFDFDPIVNDRLPGGGEG